MTRKTAGRSRSQRRTRLRRLVSRRARNVPGKHPRTFQGTKNEISSKISNTKAKQDRSLEQRVPGKRRPLAKHEKHVYAYTPGFHLVAALSGR
jgi:hypothetical protein